MRITRRRLRRIIREEISRVDEQGAGASIHPAVAACHERILAERSTVTVESNWEDRAAQLVRTTVFSFRSDVSEDFIVSLVSSHGQVRRSEGWPAPAGREAEFRVYWYPA